MFGFSIVMQRWWVKPLLRFFSLNVRANPRNVAVPRPPRNQSEFVIRRGDGGPAFWKAILIPHLCHHLHALKLNHLQSKNQQKTNKKASVAFVNKRLVLVCEYFGLVDCYCTFVKLWLFFFVFFLIIELTAFHVQLQHFSLRRSGHRRYRNTVMHI